MTPTRWARYSAEAKRSALSPSGDVAMFATASGVKVFVSAASAWEIATKHRIGKLPQAALLAADVAGFVAAEGFNELPVSIRHGQLAGNLPRIHKDPFDRMLIAQAVTADMTIVSNETLFGAYGVARLW
jgi:PIN domain nuclease of toxin-antitoxin system